MRRELILGLLLSGLMLAEGRAQWAENFAHPPGEYKPMPFWRIGGGLSEGQIQDQMAAAKVLGNYGGLTAYPSTHLEKQAETSAAYLSEDYFKSYRVMLETAKQLGLHVIIYDDNDYPSGMVGGKMEELFPQYTLKRLDKVESEFAGPGTYRATVPDGALMAAVAMNADSLERIELGKFIKDGALEWKAPAGHWKVMFFPMVVDGGHKQFLVVDYLDPVAVGHMIDMTYGEYARRFPEYFGNVIRQTFFDDVGFFRYERAWTAAFNKKFIELNGFDPVSYYPALWYDIGPDTEAIRVAFFKTRAELLSEGFPRLVAEWTAKHGIKASGHPPGNYDPTPIDMHGDIFKFYRHPAIPTADILFSYGFGQNGFKLVSSAADYYDRPVVAAEIYCAFEKKSFDDLMLDRPMMDVLVRGINFFIPCNMCYDCSDASFAKSSADGDNHVKAIQNHNEFAGRACLMLQGGRRVAEIGVLYPVESLAGWFKFDAPYKYQELKGKYGKYISPQTDYQDISGILTDEIRRDFTFVHPELLLGEKYRVADGRIKLNNPENFQEYATMILPGGNIASYKVLERLREFYDGGGRVIATTQLPFKSVELGQDRKVVELVRAIFGVEPATANHSDMTRNQSNKKGGVSTFMPHPDKASLAAFLNQTVPAADVRFESVPDLKGVKGNFSYVHKVKDGRDIYYFANSSDRNIDTEIVLRGNKHLEKWNPHDGTTEKNVGAKYERQSGSEYTRVALSLKPVSSVFYVGAAR